jgi:hypothetical protein
MAAVLNGASLTCGCLAPGEIVTVLGTAIGPSPTGLEIGADGKLATTLNGTQLLINGIPVPLLYASTGQLNAIVPYEVATGGNATIQVMSEGQVSVVCLPSCADWWNGQEQTNTLEQSKSAVLHSLTWSVLPGCATMRTADHTRPLEGI